MQETEEWGRGGERGIREVRSDKSRRTGAPAGPAVEGLAVPLLRSPARDLLNKCQKCEWNLMKQNRAPGDTSIEHVGEKEKPGNAQRRRQTSRVLCGGRRGRGGWQRQ